MDIVCRALPSCNQNNASVERVAVKFSNGGMIKPWNYMCLPSVLTYIERTFSMTFFSFHGVIYYVVFIMISISFYSSQSPDESTNLEGWMLWLTPTTPDNTCLQTRHLYREYSMNCYIWTLLVYCLIQLLKYIVLSFALNFTLVFI